MNNKIDHYILMDFIDKLIQLQSKNEQDKVTIDEVEAYFNILKISTQFNIEVQFYDSGQKRPIAALEQYTRNL